MATFGKPVELCSDVIENAPDLYLPAEVTVTAAFDGDRNSLPVLGLGATVKHGTVNLQRWLHPLFNAKGELVAYWGHEADGD